MSGADDLFSDEAPVALPDRLGRAALLLALALPLNVLGFACFTGVPGAILALLGWQIADDELQRIDAGALPAERRPRARTLRRRGFALIAFATLALLVQTGLFALGVYDALVGSVLAALGYAVQVDAP